MLPRRSPQTERSRIFPRYNPETERSGLLLGVSFGPNGERDESRSVEWLGPEAVAAAKTIEERRQTQQAENAQRRAARAAEIAAMRPGSAEKVFARTADALNLVRAKVESDAQTHRPVSERDRALVTKLSIETDLLRPYLSTWSSETGYVASDADAGDVAAAISASSVVKRWEAIGESEGVTARTGFDEHYYTRPNAPMYPVSTFLDAASDLCTRLYDEAAGAAPHAPQE